MAERQARAALSRSRAVGIVLRTAHLAAMAALAGGAWFGASAGELRGAVVATSVSGLGLLVSEASHSRHWVYQVRGVLVLAHLVAVGLLTRWGPGVLMAALIIGAVGSHLPKGLRAWSLRHGAVID